MSLKSKVLLCAIFICPFLIAYAQEAETQEEEVAVAVEADDSVPSLLSGIWENESRYVVFKTGYTESNNSSIAQIVLRTFYQWYDDRTAESADYSAANPRDKNNTTDAKFLAEKIVLHFTPLTDELYTADYGITTVQEDGDTLIADGECSGAWDMEMRYSGRKLGGVSSYHVPIAVIGNKLYLRFAVKTEDSDSVPVSAAINGTVLESGSPLSGYWKNYGSASGILACPPVTSTELLCYYVEGDAFYPIRYWETDMEYDKDAFATLTDGADTYTVPKHLLVGESVYTCTLGRRTQIRNVQRKDSFGQPYSLNSILVQKKAGVDSEATDTIQYTVRTSTICVFGEPYLTLKEGSQTLADIVAEHNARKKPLPPPQFPVHGGVIDFDWSTLDFENTRLDMRALDLGRETR